MSRRSALTSETSTLILTAIRNGHFVRHAAGLAGVHPDTVYGWLERGEAEKPTAADEEYVLFAQAYRLAEAQAIEAALEHVRERHDNWKATAWFLERRAPKEFGRRLTAEISGPDGGPLQHNVGGAVMFLPPRVDASEKKPDGSSGTST